MDTAAAVEDAAIDGCDVINLSLGGAQSSLDILDEALFNAVGAGLAAVSSAGNSGSGKSCIISRLPVALFPVAIASLGRFPTFFSSIRCQHGWFPRWHSLGDRRCECL